jgi:hypothetical protein
MVTLGLLAKQVQQSAKITTANANNFMIENSFSRLVERLSVYCGSGRLQQDFVSATMTSFFGRVF